MFTQYSILGDNHEEDSGVRIVHSGYAGINEYYED
jgi:hypothetical protein